MASNEGPSRIKSLMDLLRAEASRRREITSREIFAMTDPIMDELSRSDLCASGQQVEPLVWKEADLENEEAGHWVQAETPFGTISACRCGDWSGPWKECCGMTLNLEAAKVQAEAVYKSHVLAALTPAPQPEGRAWAIKPATIAHVIADMMERAGEPRPNGDILADVLCQVLPVALTPAPEAAQTGCLQEDAQTESAMTDSKEAVERLCRALDSKDDGTVASSFRKEAAATLRVLYQQNAALKAENDLVKRRSVPQPEGHQVRSKILELVALIDRNIYETNLDHHRLLLDGVYHTGPVVDWAHKTLTALRDLLIEYAALTSAPDAAQTDAVPVAYARADDIKIHSSWWVQRSKSSYYSVPLYVHPAAPAPGIAETIAAEMDRAKSMPIPVRDEGYINGLAFSLRALANGGSYAPR